MHSPKGVNISLTRRTRRTRRTQRTQRGLNSAAEETFSSEDTEKPSQAFSFAFFAPSRETNRLSKFAPFGGCTLRRQAADIQDNTVRLDTDSAAPALEWVDPDSLEAQDDQTLAQRARNERDAFGVLYQRHVTAIYRYVYYRVGSAADAEDLTAKAFTRALKHVHNYNDRGLPFTAWLYRIAHNVVANYHRDNSRHPSVPFDDVDAHHGEHQDADHDIDAERDRQRLMRAIRKLPEERQHLIVLKFVEQKQNSEIGEIINRSEGAVKSLYHRTLQQLREVLDADDAANRTPRISPTQQSDDPAPRSATAHTSKGSPMT